MDAVIDHAHDNIADGDVRDAARLSDRLQVGSILFLPRTLSIGPIAVAAPCALDLSIAPAVVSPAGRQRSEKPRSRRKSLNTSRPVSAASSRTRNADCSVQSVTRIFCSAWKSRIR